MSSLDDTPEGLARDVQNVERWLHEEVDRRVQRVDCLLKGPVPYQLTALDRMFLRSIGISPDERAYESQDFSLDARERVLKSSLLGARLSCLYGELRSLEDRGRRPTAAQYRVLLDEAFSGAEARSILTNSIGAVCAELDDLALLGPNVVVSSERCLTMLQRIDDRFFRYCTTRWPIVAHVQGSA